MYIIIKHKDGTETVYSTNEHGDNIISRVRMQVELHNRDNKDDIRECYESEVWPPVDIDKSQNRIWEIKSELANIDAQTIRPLRAKLACTDSNTDTEKLKELETRAEALRAELKTLES